MADDLVFPPDDIASLIGDFETSLNEDVLRSDINPSFPHSELLNIPQIMPPSVTTTTNARRPFSNAHNSHNVARNYTPISQLMKQTEELTSTLGRPLSSSMNQQLNFTNTIHTTSLNNRITIPNSLTPTEMTAGNNMNFINNSHISKAAQYLVVGGQRILSQNQSPTQNQQTGSPLHIQNSSLLDIDSSNLHNNHSGIATSPVTPSEQIQQPQQVINSNGQTKQPLVLKIPTQQQNSTHQLMPTGVQGQKVPLKGSIIKTANQQLMFVTEVNGQKVGYVIQHPKQNSSSSNTVSSQNIAVTAVTASSAPVISTSSRENLVKNMILNPINVSIASSSPSSQNEEPILISPREKESKPNEMTRLLRERLQGLRTNNINLKNQLNFKQQQIVNKTKDVPEELMNQDRLVKVNPISHNSNPVSKIISDFDNVMKERNNEKFNTIHDYPEKEEFTEEEEGQEIEFSENDLTAENNEDDSDEPLITSISVKQCNEIEDITEDMNDDEDSDSVPLALLKTETFEEPISIVCEKGETSKLVKKRKKVEQETNDSIPLSVVAASLKKGQEDGKGKKRGRKKKRKDEDEPVKPILAYQVFFKEEQQRLKEENAMYKENFGELSKKIGQLWENLDAEKKKAYQDDYLKAKAEYMTKLEEYKEKKAKEFADSQLSIPHEIEGGDLDDEEMENIPLKKPVNKKGKKKVNNNQKKLTSKIIATSSTLSPPFEPMDEESNESFTNSPVIDQMGKPLKRKYNKTKKSIAPSPPSPSPPSTDTEDTSDEEGEDSKISRIRELAAKATKQLKKIEKQTVKGKGKDVPKRNKIVKMEVETVSEKVIMEHPSTKNTIFETETKSQQEQLSNEKTFTSTTHPTTKSESKMVKVKETRTTIQAKEKGLHSVEDDEKSSELSQLSPKTSFKIPKRTNGENGQATQGPRICVRETCPNPVKVTRERGAQYCSNECLVLYCREVFDSWVLDRQQDDNRI